MKRMKPRLVKHKGFWMVKNPLGYCDDEIPNWVINRWAVAYYWCNTKNFPRS